MDILSQIGKSGVLVLDAHRNPWDILLTARYIFLNYRPSKIVMPIAGYVYFVPILKQIIYLVATRYQITFMPVYRRAEMKPVNILMKLLCSFYPEELDYVQRETANNHFIKEAIKACKTPNQFVIVAPYGSPIWYGGKVKYGVRKILEDAPTRVLSQTKWNYKSLIFETKLGKYRRDLLEGFQNLTQ